MAKATVEREEVVVTNKVILELTEAEAQFLACISGCIGGRPENTARGFMRNISTVLGGHGFDWERNNPFRKYLDDESAITFSTFDPDDQAKFRQELPY